MKFNPTKHPSGRPIQKTKTKGRSIWRVPDRGYVTPRLRNEFNTNAIGFTANITTEYEEE